LEVAEGGKHSSQSTESPTAIKGGMIEGSVQFENEGAAGLKETECWWIPSCLRTSELVMIVSERN